jgi:cell division protein FtsQ
VDEGRPSGARASFVRRRGVRTALVVGATLALAVLIARSSLFSVDRVTVTGASHLSTRRVIEESGVRGRDALWLDTAAIEGALEEDPWIAHATVARRLPSSVEIAVVERVPVAAVEAPGGFTMVAADATVLGTRPSAGRLPLIQPGPTEGQADPYDAPARMLGALSSTVRAQVASVSPEAGGDLVMRLRSGTLVRFGPATNLRAKADAFAAVLAYVAAQHSRVASIDVRFPAAPSARLEDGTSILPSS